MEDTLTIVTPIHFEWHLSVGNNFCIQRHVFIYCAF